MNRSTKLTIISRMEGELSVSTEDVDVALCWEEDETEKCTDEITNVRIFDLSSSVNSNKNNNNCVVIIVHRI